MILKWINIVVSCDHVLGQCIRCKYECTSSGLILDDTDFLDVVIKTLETNF